MKQCMIILIVCSILSNFRCYENPNALELSCKALLNERNNIWNEALEFSYDFEDFKKHIRLVASDELLLDDLESYKSIIDKPRDIEKVKHIEISDCRTKIFNSYCAIKAFIIWDLETLDGSEMIKTEYFIEMKKHGLDWYLSSLNPID